MSRRNSKQKPMETAKFYDNDDLDDAFDAEHSIHNPFSSGQVSASSSKWSIKDSWRKLEQMIENRDKTNQAAKHKENHSQELSNFSNDLEIMNDLLDYSIHEGEEIQEGDTSYVPADSSYSDISEEKDASLGGGEINVSVPLNSESAKTNNDKDRGNKDSGSKAGDSSSTGSEKDAATLNNSIKDNKKDDITPAVATNRTHAMHKIQFSKIKKNCSIERINDEPDEKDAESLDAKRRDESIKASNSGDKLSSSVHASQHTSQHTSQHASQHATQPSPSTVHKQAPQIRFSATPGKQPPLGSRSASFSSTSALKRRINERMNLSECEEEGSIDGFSTTGSSERALFKQSAKPQASSTPNTSVDDPIPSLPYFMSFVVDRARERFNLISFTSYVCTFFILIFAIQLSPLSSFANGFLIGLIFCTLLLIILIIYALNYIFVKIDYENDLHERIMSNQRWKKFPAYRRVQQPDEKTTIGGQQNTGVHEGWFFELVYSKKLGVDRLSAAEKTDYDKMPDTKLQLTYIKLEGTIMRVYVPKADQSKKLKPDMEKGVNFLKMINKMNQTIYDFSKMNTKKIQLWMPRSIINRKKYLFSRKFPFILTIEETKRSQESLPADRRAPFALILFCRTNRDKEEWYNKFRQSIEMSDQNLKIQHLSTAASTPDEVTHEQEAIPRTKSLDIGNISTEFEHLSNFLSYDSFIQDLISQSPHSPGASSGPPSNGSQTNESQPLNNTNLFWFNALVGRVFFDFLTHAHWTRWVKLKIQRKLSRIKLPYFINTITLKDVNLGTSMPKFLSVANNPVIDERGIWIDFDLDYQGCFSMTLETKLDLMKLKETKAPERELKPMKSPTLAGSQSTFDYDDLSDPESVVSLSDEDSEENLSIEADARQARFVKLLDKLVQHRYFQSATDTKFLKKKMEEVSNLPIMLTVNVFKLKGQLTLNLPPSPSDRLWYGFRTISEFQLTVEPSFGERTLSFAPIAQILSKKLKQEFHKILVLPNLDDIVLGNVMMGNEDIEIVDEVP